MKRGSPSKEQGTHKETRTFPGSVSGTYLHVMVADPWDANVFDDPPDLRYSVLYLLPSGSFAWFDYWSGFHYERHAGSFTRKGAVLTLHGQGSLFCDCPEENYSQRTFHQQVTLRQRNGKRTIRGLNNTDHLFIGWGIHIPFDGPGNDLFPQSWAELQGWIDSFLGNSPSSIGRP